MDGFLFTKSLYIYIYIYIYICICFYLTSAPVRRKLWKSRVVGTSIPAVGIFSPSMNAFIYVANFFIHWTSPRTWGSRGSGEAIGVTFIIVKLRSSRIWMPPFFWTFRRFSGQVLRPRLCHLGGFVQPARPAQLLRGRRSSLANSSLGR